jgi:hypothetical protein
MSFYTPVIAAVKSARERQDWHNVITCPTSQGAFKKQGKTSSPFLIGKESPN